MLFDRFSVKLRKKFERGDVVALKCVDRFIFMQMTRRSPHTVKTRSPADSKLVVKRIVALEGDTVRPRICEYLPSIPLVDVDTGTNLATISRCRGPRPGRVRMGRRCARTPRTFVPTCSLPGWPASGDEPFRTEDSNRFGPVCSLYCPNVTTISELTRTCC